MENQKPILIKDLGLFIKEGTIQKRHYGLFKCFCGKEFKADITKVKSCHTKSCGCRKIKVLIDRNTKHNLVNHKLYWVFASIKDRCYNKRSQRYKDYGARGISVYNEWLNDFMSFYNWAIQNGYKEGLSIDRIDNDGNYEPGNCRFTNCSIQNRNIRVLRKNNTSGYKGVSYKKQSKKYQVNISIDNQNIFLGYYKTALGGALAYDKYVKDNNLEHTTNF